MTAGLLMATGCHSRSARSICFLANDTKSFAEVRARYGPPDQHVDGIEGATDIYKGSDGSCRLNRDPKDATKIGHLQWRPKPPN